MYANTLDKEVNYIVFVNKFESKIFLVKILNIFITRFVDFFTILQISNIIKYENNNINMYMYYNGRIQIERVTYTYVHWTLF